MRGGIRMYGYGCCSGFGHGGYGFGGYSGGYGYGGYALILVLFILLVIIGSSWNCR